MIFNRSTDYTKRFCSDLRNLATEIIKYEKKEMLPLTDEKIESYYQSNILPHLQENTL